MGNLVIVSNRLPVSVKRVNGKLEFYPSVGGLATGLSSYASRGRSKWVGWPGLPSDDLTEAEHKQIAKELKKHHCYPVFLTQKQLDEYYNGYSNSVLWPLFHNLEVKTGETAKSWRAYQEANALFAEEALLLSDKGSTIWVHDYQLLLVPELLRRERPRDQIGFFLHIPFPPAEVFKRLKHARPLVWGMLGADLVGFHTISYTENFLEAARQLKVGTTEPKRVILPSRVARVTEFPMGIDYAKFVRATKQRAVQSGLRKLRWKYRGKKVILTVDRLDPTKGLVERLKAYQKLLQITPSIRGKIVMVMIATPSRTEIDEYKQLKQRLEALVTKVNAQFGTARWQPVEYLYTSLPFEKLSPYFQRADIAFIAPIRDGMNLVAKEYLASHPRSDGVLILSETAGAAEELQDAVLVNPARPSTLVKGLSQALTMPRHELKHRVRRMQQHLEQFTVQAWADNFMDALQRPYTIPGTRTRNLNAARSREIVAAYQQSAKRVILLDYDGVLRDFEPDPRAAAPSPKTKKLLRRLAENKANDVILISGRGKDDLQAWFGDLPLALAAEHGALFRRKGGRSWHKLTGSSGAWKREVTAILEHFTAQTPGSLLERKQWSVAWHYRGASPYYSQKNLVTIKRLLRPIAQAHNLKIESGHKVLEVRPYDIVKDRVAQEWLIHDHDFILCIGDDATDEDMFADLPPEAFTVKVGRGNTAARLRAKDVDAVLALLSKFK